MCFRAVLSIVGCCSIKKKKISLVRAAADDAPDGKYLVRCTEWARGADSWFCQRTKLLRKMMHESVLLLQSNKKHKKATSMLLHLAATSKLHCVKRP